MSEIHYDSLTKMLGGFPKIKKLGVFEGAKDINFENGVYHIELQPGAWFLAKFNL